MTAPVRTCLACGGRDDHPRHVFDVGIGADVTLHMDCCALTRDCEICKAQLADAPKGAKGDKLRDYLLKTGPRADQPGWTAPTDEQADAAAATKEG